MHKFRTFKRRGLERCNAARTQRFEHRLRKSCVWRVWREKFVRQSSLGQHAPHFDGIRIQILTANHQHVAKRHTTFVRRNQELHTVDVEAHFSITASA